MHSASIHSLISSFARSFFRSVVRSIVYIPFAKFHFNEFAKKIMQGIVTYQQVSNCSVAHRIFNNSFKQFLFWTENKSNYFNIEDVKDVKTYNNTNKYNRKGFCRRAGD